MHNIVIDFVICSSVDLFLPVMFCVCAMCAVTRKHRKGENIWFKGNNNPANKPDIYDYPSDCQLTEAWQLGLQQAQAKMRDLGIVPDTDNEAVIQNAWFFSPHRVDATRERDIQRQMAEDDGDNIQVHVVNVNEGPDVLNDAEIGTHLRNIVDVDEVDVESEESDNTKDSISKSSTIISSTLPVPGAGNVHKSTLFSMLNASPSGLSTDRLKRVQAKCITTIKPGDEDISSGDITLFDDVAIYIKDKGKQPCYKLARIQRMRNKDRATVDFKRPVSLDGTFPKLQITVIMYEKQDEQTFVYTKDNVNEFNISSIIQKVRLYIEDPNSAPVQFTLHNDDKSSLDLFLTNVQTKSSVKTKATKSSQNAPLDGRIVTVENQDSSKRKRWKITYEHT